MKTYDKTWLMASTAADRLRVARYGTWDGTGPTPYFERCRGFHQPTGTMLMLSRDVGGHTSGWWKNPDYERCLHLSLSFRDPVNGQLASRDKKLAREWVGLFFGKDRARLWCEPPFSPQGKAMDVWHYRLFCNPEWIPILPRGEVYSRELTEAGWLSFSDARAGMEEATERALDHLLS